MNIFLLIIIILSWSITNGQRCQGKFNETITGECAYVDDCRGTLLDVQACELRRCCIAGTNPPSATQCRAANSSEFLYNTSRATFLRAVLNYGINEAGICFNCQAEAAFLAVAATMTDNFQIDESTGTDAQFAKDDTKYGNTQAGDGSRFRQRGFFGLRGRTMYQRLQTLMRKYQSLTNPELVALTQNSIEIASLLWKKPDLLNGSALTQYADGTFFGFSMLWYKLTGGIEKLPDGAKQYSKFLRQLKCGGDLYPGQGSVCKYNATHQGTCSADCIKGLEDSGEYCGCSGGKGDRCPNSPAHVRCCLDTCSQELKMDLGFVLDASGSVGAVDYGLQRQFTKDLLRRVNVGQNKTHVGIINYSTRFETLTWLNTDYDLQEKLQRVDAATYFGGSTDTAAALVQVNNVFSYERGLRQPEEGATPVLFVITDGASDNRAATIQAAAVLKNKSIHIVSVGIGNGPDLVELNAICTSPASENYFPMSNYSALEQKLNQFASKSCSEPAPLPINTTVTGEIGKDKYKFLKIEIVMIGNKTIITVKLFNGKVKLFYSFTSRNPKDPNDFEDYQTRTSDSHWLLEMLPTSLVKGIPRSVKADNDQVTLVIDKPDTEVQFVYLGIKGVEDDNKFEVTFDDCANVICNSKAASSTMKLSIILMAIIATLFLP